MEKHIVVSTYKEDISWVNTLNNIGKIIYSKNNGVVNGVINEEIITIDNIGREAQTYIQYILDNYENLPNLVIFSQGNPFPHSKDFINKVNLINKKSWLGDIMVVNDITGAPSHKNLPMKEYLMKNNLTDEIEFNFSPGAIFSVDKGSILSHSLEFYENLNNDIKKYHLRDIIVDSTKIHSLPWVMERLWGVIFKL